MAAEKPVPSLLALLPSLEPKRIKRLGLPLDLRRDPEELCAHNLSDQRRSSLRAHPRATARCAGPSGGSRRGISLG